MIYPVLVSLSFSYLVALALYRLFFHPLHKFPGPVLAALTDWYEIYYNIVHDGGLVVEIERLHNLYGEPELLRAKSSSNFPQGPVVRTGPNTVSYSCYSVK